MTLNKNDMHALGHMDIIHADDIVFDDFSKPQFKIGPNHKRVGTPYDSMFDMPIYRIESKTPTKMTA